MRIIDLTPELESFYFKCLVDDPAWLAEAGDYKKAWYETMKPRGLRVKLALADRDEPVGLVQYLPIEESIVAGRDLFFLYCIWVENNERFGINHQGRGFGQALLAAFEEDARQSGKKGVAAWGLSVPGFMSAGWFKARGYEEADATGVSVLLWKTWGAGVAQPAWVKPKKSPRPLPGKTTVTCFRLGWCPEANKTFSRARRAAASFGDRVVYREIDTTDRRAYEEWGRSDALFIDDAELPIGPAPSYETIRDAIIESMKKGGEKE